MARWSEVYVGAIADGLVEAALAVAGPPVDQGEVIEPVKTSGSTARP